MGADLPPRLIRPCRLNGIRANHYGQVVRLVEEQLIRSIDNDFRLSAPWFVEESKEAIRS